MQERAYKNYLLGLLTLILLFNFVDRLALGIVLQDIKAEFDLSDTELGLLSGLAFSLFYAVMGIPIARWADRGNRVALISLTAVLWSVAVALSGFAKSFAQLLIIRIGVAVGEAGCVPPAFSLMADHFNRAERARAGSIYQFAGVLCAIPGYWLAGWLNEHYGWRITFMVLGIPGLILALVAWLTLKEPRLMAAGRKASTPAVVQPSLKEVCVKLAANATFRNLLVCTSVMSFFAYGLGQWHAPYFIRSHGLETAEIGMWLTVVWCAGGFIGTYLGAVLPARYAAHNERLQLKASAIAIACSGALTICVYLSPNPYLAFVLQGLGAIGLTACNGPFFATTQTLVPGRMRAMSIAIVLFFANLIGAGLGPLAAGALSDAFQYWAGAESLRYALLTLAPGYFWVSWHAWQASKTVMRDLARAQEELDARTEGQPPLAAPA